MSDLRDSDNIEQDADVIILLYREAYYETEANTSAAEVLELIVAKNCNGPSGTATAYYYKTTGRLQDPAWGTTK